MEPQTAAGQEKPPTATEMDLAAFIERAFEEMEWKDIVSTLEAAGGDLLEDDSSPPPSPLPLTLPAPPSPESDGPGFDTHPQLNEYLSGDYDGCINQGAYTHQPQQPDPSMAAPGLDIEQTAPFLQQVPLYAPSDMQSGNFCYVPGVSQGQYNNTSLLWPPGSMDRRLIPVEFINGEVVNELAADAFTPTRSAALPMTTSVSKKRKRANQQQDDRPYIKRPPNAFMLFRKEQRPKVVAELNISNSAAVNTILGQRWHSLSKEEQAKYFEEAHKERLLHAQLYPDWSANDNYGKNRKRKRTTAHATMKPSTCQTGQIEPFTSHAGVMEPSTCQAGVIEPRIPWGSAMVPSACQIGWIEPCASYAGVTVPSTCQTGWIEPSTPWRSAMVPSACQTVRIEPCTSYAGVTVPSNCRAGTNEPSTSVTAMMWPPQMPSAATHLAQGDIYLPDSPAAAPTVLLSPAAPNHTAMTEINHSVADGGTA